MYMTFFFFNFNYFSNLGKFPSFDFLYGWKVQWLLNGEISGLNNVPRNTSTSISPVLSGSACLHLLWMCLQQSWILERSFISTSSQFSSGVDLLLAVEGLWSCSDADDCGQEWWDSKEIRELVKSNTRRRSIPILAHEVNVPQSAERHRVLFWGVWVMLVSPALLLLNLVMI